MPSSEESQWLVSSLKGKAPPSGAGERSSGTRVGLYTEEMTTQTSKAASTDISATSADPAEHDLIDSSAAQFHEEAIKQVFTQTIFLSNGISVKKHLI